MRKASIILIINFANLAWSFNQLDYLDNKISFPTDSLDGKNLICKWTGKGEKVFPQGIYAFKFKDNEVEGYSLNIKKNVAEIDMWNKDYVHSITTNKVRWWSYWHLNRKNLILKFVDGLNSDIQYQCRVLPNLQAYEEEMNGYKIQLQKLIDDKILKETEKNKI